MSLIAHVAILDDWESARNIGEYAVSTRGVSLDEKGYVQAVPLDGVGQVLDARYADTRFDLLLVVLDTDALAAEGVPVSEQTPGRPRLHGPIQTDGGAVLGVFPIERSGDGFVVPDPGLTP
jgi:uncharacterized protein (DUF952 family)